MAWFVGVRVFDVQIYHVGSLKEKRFVLRSVKDRIAQRFNVSLAEIGHHDKWQRSEIAVAIVAGDRTHVERTLDRVRDLLDREPELRVIETMTEIL